ncbi:MAG: saccharopine dehydrogenase NADP-binding domain-containing protein [Anaerolineae bacterium]|nr:saccharopine dehydrogenase NADP-binding domain-containing protein [Anaerolineae bacterium]
MKKVLVLGAGLVTRPHVRYLLDVPEFEVTVASRTVEKAEELVKGHPRGRAVALNVQDEAALEDLIREADLAVSMLPYVYHPTVAALCVKHGKHMVTTSYVKDAMAALDRPAREAGVILLNEIGVDPGIDHMSAMRLIHGVEAKGGKITSFVSWCGGLPSPEANDNPLGYKFSWSPKGVLLAGRNPARFQRDGEVVEVPGDELFEHYWPVVIDGLGEFEGYPNRDSLPYADLYQIEPEDWMFRGTLRNLGWCDTFARISELGLLDDSPLSGASSPAAPGGPSTYREFLARLLGTDSGTDLRQYLAERWDMARDAKPLADLEWLGFFSDEPLPAGAESPVDILTACTKSKMAYQPGERDMLIMQHEFVAEYPDRKEAITSTMIAFGIPFGDTSMSRTVGLPSAIATRMILQGEISGISGVHTPVIPEIYEPVLQELETLGISLEEKVEVLEA